MPNTFVFVGITRIGNELAPKLVEAGFTPAEGIADADVIFTFTPFINDTEEVYFGSEGLITSAKPGAYLINLSATTYSMTKEIAALAEVSDLHAIDAPLFVHNAVREHAYADPAQLSAFVGADAQSFAAVEPFLAALSQDVVLCGESASGQLAKAAATLQFVSDLTGIIEADALCRVVDGPGSAQSTLAHIFDVMTPSQEIKALYDAITSRSLTSSYTAEVMLGEVTSALASADDVNLVLPHAESIEHLLQLLFTIGGADKAPAALSLLYSDEEECARNGLDWSLADNLYDAHHHLDEYDDFDYCDHDHEHEHEHEHYHNHDYDHGHDHGHYHEHEHGHYHDHDDFDHGHEHYHDDDYGHDHDHGHEHGAGSGY